MIYLEGLESIVECIYLNEDLDNRISSCNILVNPSNIKYMAGKTIILNTTDYPKENIDELLKNNCRIISRIYIDYPEVEIQPYILRVNSNVQWNGKIISDYKNFTDLFSEDNNCEFSLDNYTLYFPKIEALGKGERRTMDNYGNLTCAGWASQQVGLNLVPSTIFTDLDILKTKKIKF